MLAQVIQLIGSLLVLSAFVAAQRGRLDQSSVAYLLVNVIGSGILAVLALVERQWGFLLLEGVWAVVSLAGLVGHARRGPAREQRRGRRMSPPAAS